MDNFQLNNKLTESNIIICFFEILGWEMGSILTRKYYPRGCRGGEDCAIFSLRDIPMSKTEKE